MKPAVGWVSCLCMVWLATQAAGERARVCQHQAAGRAALPQASPPCDRHCFCAGVDDATSLLELKAAMVNGGSVLSTWTDQTSPCGWRGVTCTGGRVAQLCVCLPGGLQRAERERCLGG